MYIERCVNKSKLAALCATNGDCHREKHVKTAFWASILRQIRLKHFEIIISKLTTVVRYLHF